jgi:hypothetical protein
MIGLQSNRRFIECVIQRLELAQDRKLIAGTLH